MKLKITYLVIVCTSLALTSCRDNDDIIPSIPIEKLNKNEYLRLSKTMYDSILKRDSLNNLEDPPKDPPKTGTNWKTNN